MRDLLAEITDSIAAEGDLARGRGVATLPVLGRRAFLVEAASRGGAPSVVPKGGVFLHEPTAALLRPSDFPPLAHRRPDFASLRHVLVRFSFMLDRLPPRHRYETARLLITLGDSSAVVRLQRPDWVTTEVESAASVTTEFSAALNGMIRLGADRTRVSGTKQQTGFPIITAENRGRAGFGWFYQAQDGKPLWPRVEFALAVVELPITARTLSGSLSMEATISEPRFGVLRSTCAIPGEPPLPFSLDLGGAEAS